MDDIYKSNSQKYVKCINKSAIVKKKNNFVNKCATYKKELKNKLKKHYPEIIMTIHFKDKFKKHTGHNQDRSTKISANIW